MSSLFDIIKWNLTQIPLVHDVVYIDNRGNTRKASAHVRRLLITPFKPNLSEFKLYLPFTPHGNKTIMSNGEHIKYLYPVEYKVGLNLTPIKLINIIYEFYNNTLDSTEVESIISYFENVLPIPDLILTIKQKQKEGKAIKIIDFIENNIKFEGLDSYLDGYEILLSSI